MAFKASRPIRRWNVLPDIQAGGVLSRESQHQNHAQRAVLDRAGARGSPCANRGCANEK
jgi:hypothetical protein